MRRLNEDDAARVPSVCIYIATPFVPGTLQQDIVARGAFFYLTMYLDPKWADDEFYMLFSDGIVWRFRRDNSEVRDKEGRQKLFTSVDPIDLSALKRGTHKVLFRSLKEMGDGVWFLTVDAAPRITISLEPDARQRGGLAVTGIAVKVHVDNEDRACLSVSVGGKDEKITPKDLWLAPGTTELLLPVPLDAEKLEYETYDKFMKSAQLDDITGELDVKVALGIGGTAFRKALFQVPPGREVSKIRLLWNDDRPETVSIGSVDLRLLKEGVYDSADMDWKEETIEKLVKTISVMNQHFGPQVHFRMVRKSENAPHGSGGAEIMELDQNEQDAAPGSRYAIRTTDEKLHWIAPNSNWKWRVPADKITYRLVVEVR